MIAALLKNKIDLSVRFDKTLACDGQKDRETQIQTPGDS